ncbi:hypothetical protein [Epilithonimonas sp.]|uniref:hypothetical protein n=1 Tax=Epilithonimonas sp. TaxID=2894511 RepID=UPI00289C621D|nr:hypothetical protein [Epilithonimonas sp.]
MRNKFLLCNVIFILSLIILFLNDHFLKLHFHNWFTGKLSDVAGIILFPFLLSFLFPRLRHSSVYITALFFTFWKSIYSEKFIEIYNLISPISIHRVVDYTDLFVLIFLVIPYCFIRNQGRIKFLEIGKISPAFLVLPSVLVLMSTSPSGYYHYNPNRGNISFSSNFVFSVEGKNKDEVISEFSKRNISVHKDTAYIINEHYYQLLNGKIIEKNLKSETEIYKINQDSLKQEIFKKVTSSDDYVIDSLQFGDEKVKNVRFGMFNVTNPKTGVSAEIHLRYLTTDKNLSEGSVQRKLKKFYKEAIKEEFKKF